MQVVHILLLRGCCSGEWLKREFKPYNFNALGQPTEGGHLHPLLKVLLATTTSSIFCFQTFQMIMDASVVDFGHNFLV